MGYFFSAVLATFILQSVLRFLFSKFGRFYKKKNTHTCTRSQIISFTFYHCFKFKGTKTDFLWRFFMECVDIFFSIRKLLNVPRTVFQRYHPGMLRRKIPYMYITFFSLVLKPDMLKGAFQKINLDIFHIVESWGSYCYRYIKQIMNRGFAFY